MERIKLKVKLGSKGFMPKKAHDIDAGFDLYAPSEVVIMQKQSVSIDLDICVAIPEGYTGFLMSKSGLMCTKDIVCAGGVIDSGYTGRVVARMYNRGTKAYRFERGDKVTQMVLLPIPSVDVEEVSSLEDSERGDGGFGSTGKR